MTRPKAVVFDLGKVLIDFDYSRATQRLAPRCRVPLPAIHQTLTGPALLFRYETGQLSTDEYFHAVCDATGFGGSLEEFAHLFGDIFDPIPEMIALLECVRAQGVPTYIFSNTNPLAVAHVRRHYRFFGAFQGYILSYEHGAMKPDPRLYKVVEHLTGCAGAELLYLDDRPENIETGRQRGWLAIHHQSIPDTTRQLQTLRLIA